MCRKSGLLFLCFLFPIVCHAQLQGGPLVNNLGELVALVDVNFTNRATQIISPPGIPFEQDLNIVQFDDSFEASFIDTLVSELKGTAVTYPVRVIESNTVPRTRVYLNDADEVAHTAQVQVVDYPNIMIEAFFGLPPAWLSAEEIIEWYNDRDTLRETVSLNLMHTSQVPNYVDWIMSMWGSSSGGGSNTNHVGIAEIGFVDLKRTEIGDVNLSIHAPVEVGKLDVFETAMLPTLSWKHSARLNRNTDPIVWRYEGTMPKYFTAGNGTLDTDGDNIPDAFEKLVLRTIPDLADSDGDGLSDWSEIYIYGLNANNEDSDGDGLLDEWEVQYQLNPNDPNGANGANGDSDGDGLTNGEEQQLNSDPNHPSPEAQLYHLDNSFYTENKPMKYTIRSIDQQVPASEFPTSFISVPYATPGIAWAYKLCCPDSIWYCRDPKYFPNCEPGWIEVSQGRTEISSAYRYTTTSEGYLIKNYRKIKYRFKVSRSIQNILYYIQWAEVFYPESGGQPSILAIHKVKFFGQEGTRYIGIPDEGDAEPASAYLPFIREKTEGNFILDPPTEPGNVYLSELHVELVPDYNHDRSIDENDRDRASTRNPYRFWINNDDDQSPDTGNDSPSAQNGDGSNNQVDSVRDLVDFFPIFIDIKEMLDILGTNDYHYALQYSLGGNFIYTELTPNTAGVYLVERELAENLAEEPLNTITGSGNGHCLRPDFLSSIQNNGGGIILFEASHVGEEPLVLNVVNSSGAVVFSTELSLKLSNVEDMYAHINLRPDGQGKGTEPNIENPPNGQLDDKHFVFVHGYNVSPEAARGWNAEIFKRMYWSGSHATFHGVTWEGNISQWKHDWPVLGQKTPNYHANVVNALKEAHKLADYINDLKAGGAEVVVAAHSLGNMLVSEAITRHGAQVDKYFMANAAVAAECYDPTTNSLDMVHSAWGDPNNGGFDERLYSAEWHELFDDTDGRNALTWNNFFGDMLGQTTVYNYYSKGEDVLGKHDHDDNPGDWEPIRSIFSGDQAWALQEKLKGSFWAGLTGETHGGWGFNSDYQSGGVLNPDTGEYIIAPTPELATSERVTDTMLQNLPFYKPGGIELDELYDPTLGSSFADQNQHFLLATYVPSLSLPAGANEINNFPSGRNFNINSSFQNGWPESRLNDPDKQDRWLHSDLKDIAYPYVYKLFDNWVSTGGLR